MINWKKAGLTALAGSLVATSAFAGAVSVSGTANLTYTANGGQEDTGEADEGGAHDGNRWGLNKSLSFSGSGEMDNGWTVSVSQTLKDGSSTGLGMTIDMGDMGSLNYEADTGARGIGKIKDMMPTADEDVGNGIDVDGSGTAGGLSGTVSGGTQGFHYSKTVSDMIEIGIGYAPKSQAGGANGAVSGTGAEQSNVSGFVKIDPMDGLEIGVGVGEADSTVAAKTDDHTTVYATYVWGNATIGYQISDKDSSATAAGSDDEQTRWGVLYAVNDEMSVSYQNHVNDNGTATDEEATGWSASYTSGGMTFKVHRNSADDVSNATANESEHTEVGITFAF